MRRLQWRDSLEQQRQNGLPPSDTARRRYSAHEFDGEFTQIFRHFTIFGAQSRTACSGGERVRQSESTNAQQVDMM